jgi:hypothetical protein
MVIVKGNIKDNKIGLAEVQKPCVLGMIEY